MATNNQLNILKDKRKRLLPINMKELYQYSIELITQWGDTTANVNYLKGVKSRFRGRRIEGNQAVDLIERLAVGLTARPGSASDITTLRSLKTQAKLTGFKNQTMVELVKILTANNP